MCVLLVLFLFVCFFVCFFVCLFVFGFFGCVLYSILNAPMRFHTQHSRKSHQSINDESLVSIDSLGDVLQLMYYIWAIVFFSFCCVFIFVTVCCTSEARHKTNIKINWICVCCI